MLDVEYANTNSSTTVCSEGLPRDRFDGRGGFANCLTENCTFVYANSDPVIDRAKTAATSQNFLKQLARIRHHILTVWAFEDVIVSQISVTYTRKDASTLTVPAVTIWKLQEELIDECQIYVDASPLFER
ncbi:nuclear transport factor 2 family protein [Caballeronia ptereochthonis]|uniref:nuclear transport factor 2 family protein n=1 Tax=Caballeronia ptereochthonis TaxID=1777144 RepID=UPI00313436CD